MERGDEPFWKGAPWLALPDMTEDRFRQLVADARQLDEPDASSNELLRMLRSPALVMGKYATQGGQAGGGASARGAPCLRCLRPPAAHSADAWQRCFPAELCAEIAGWLLAGEAPEGWLEKAKSLSLSTTCGHVFKEDDWAYRCNNCATDPTCCVCAACFKDSSCHGTANPAQCRQCDDRVTLASATR